MGKPAISQVVKKESASQQIINYIISEIKTGNLNAGDKLPNERIFAEQLGVSRYPLREAFSALSLLGILDIRHGEGSYISNFNSDTFSQILYIYTLLDRTSLDDLFDIRIILESACAKLAATRHDQAGLDRLLDAQKCHAQAVQQFANGEASAETVFDLDYEFHCALSRASQNNFLSKFVQSICYSFDDAYLAEDKQLSEHFMKTSVEFHAKIVSAIDARDAALAEAYAFEHLEYLKTTIPRIQ